MFKNHTPANASSSLADAIERSANHCFVCGAANPQGLHLNFSFDASDPDRITSRATVNLTRAHEGPPGCIHGGIIATLLDEAMGKLNLPLGVIAMTRHMEIDYLRPAPLHTQLTVVGTHVRRDGRKLNHTAELIHPDGSVLARSKGFFLIIDPSYIAKNGKREPATT